MMADNNTMSSGNKSDNIEEGMSSICLDKKGPPPGTKREDYLTWDEYFMSSAFLSAMRSKDPHTQVGAVIVNTQVSTGFAQETVVRQRPQSFSLQNRIVGVGYNGMPTGCSDDTLPWGKTSSDRLQTKYMYVCHAEMNAILNKVTHYSYIY